MPAHAEDLSFPHRSPELLSGPVFGWGFLSAVIALIRQKALTPTLPRMSEQWLLSHASEFNRLES
jgi:hypothetical protein